MVVQASEYLKPTLYFKGMYTLNFKGMQIISQVLCVFFNVQKRTAHFDTNLHASAVSDSGETGGGYECCGSRSNPAIAMWVYHLFLPPPSNTTHTHTML